MSEHIIKATGRSVEGKGASRRLRRAASIPAIIYGGKAAPQPVQLDHEKVWLASQNEWFYSSILTLDVDGKSESVLLRDMQRHPYKQIIMHLDFQRVDENQAIRVAVPLHFLNEDKSPAGKAADVVVTHELNEVEISCLPKDLPEFLEVDLSALAVGDIVHLSELKLPKGVEIPELKLGKEHDVAVVIAKHGKEEVEEATDAPAADVPAAKVAKKDEDKK
ncbi:MULTISPECIES: 50S ribosomal protein L25/general stress protein Ctc [unclassified Lysobacter]|uniref:50S ribosomal protein L25/general stress protein Ctc n=1 Tax=unclassified Lysobacter TaxID=2635362 RepID=UPI0006F2A549|nr:MULTISPECIES: 50S ribosomal protein L25/general stress protein Ctc [unclassified Lysobacter]KQZ66698.1 50S ribosomal protein L25 [Lysobacter sp. Root559]KRA78883.1 50S ribosomal protein L25 [Lysobacter sp. Root667]KRC32849.1 50S ribosomal protein L25 [Lysobacter sp. Root76]KRD67808.1 50S ribosomal protein L25 [Lysobacter sp. Root96]